MEWPDRQQGETGGKKEKGDKEKEDGGKGKDRQGDKEEGEGGQIPGEPSPPLSSAPLTQEWDPHKDSPWEEEEQSEHEETLGEKGEEYGTPRITYGRFNIRSKSWPYTGRQEGAGEPERGKKVGIYLVSPPKYQGTLLPHGWSPFQGGRGRRRRRRP